MEHYDQKHSETSHHSHYPPQPPVSHSPASSCTSPLFASALLRSTILLRFWPVDVPTTGLADRPFLSRQERPPPKRPPTCWCPLEARASPAPPVRPNQGPDRGEPACEITPLSCSHWARDTLHPCRSSARPPPNPASILHRMSMAPFWRKKKGKERDSGKQGSNCPMGVFYWVWGYSQNSSYTSLESQLKPRLSFIPVWFPRFTPVSLYRLQRRKK